MNAYRLFRRAIGDNVVLILDSGDHLRGFFGDSDAPSMTVWVNRDLPDAAAMFVLDHELYHIRDTAKNWIWREIKANVYSGFLHPVGFCQVVG